MPLFSRHVWKSFMKLFSAACVLTIIKLSHVFINLREPHLIIENHFPHHCAARKEADGSISASRDSRRERRVEQRRVDSRGIFPSKMKSPARMYAAYIGRKFLAYFPSQYTGNLFLALAASCVRGTSSPHTAARYWSIIHDYDGEAKRLVKLGHGVCGGGRGWARLSKPAEKL